MPVRECYAGKRVLITGTTGFLGKVLLEKVLYSLDCVEKVYVLIRAKEGANLSERFKKQIVSSVCFDRLRGKHKGRFDQFIESKVMPIQGDLQKQNLGMHPTTMQDVIDNCHIIMNCAASIDFNARIDHAIDSNIRGSIRMLELARKIKHLDIFTHISTCYVNCDQKGLIKEEIFEKDMHPEDQYRMLQDMPLQQMIESTPRIIGKYPNTYTYTKSLCERLLQKRQGNVPLCIVRPSIINTSYLEPVPGWIDSIAAAAALFMFVGLGIVTEVKGNIKYIGDTVPVDVVVATIIVASARNIGNKNLLIYHAGSSDRNPLTWKEMRGIVMDFWNNNVSKSRMGKSNVIMTENQTIYRLNKLKRQVPMALYKRLGFLLDKNSKKNYQKMVKTMAKGDQIANIFKFFVTNEWIYECRNFKGLWDFLTADERKQYLIDMADVDVKRFIYINNYGIQKYILKQNVELDRSNLLNLMSEQSYFSDMKWAMNIDLPLNNRKKVITQMKTKILASSRVLKAIEEEVQKKIAEDHISLENARKTTLAQAQGFVKSVVGEVKISVLRTMVWTVHKSFKSMYDKININTEMLERIREIEENSSNPIVLMPTHRSYLDFLVVSYIFMIYKLRLPNFIADQTLLQANLLPFLVRSSGAFFFERVLYGKSRLYRIIFDKYLELQLREGSTLEFFIEGTRSRSGKILSPRFEILNIILDTLYYGKVPEVCLIPMTVNYQKVLEGDTFPGQLLGEEKVEQSLLRTIKAIPIVRKNLGSVYVEICQPMMARQFSDNLRLQCAKEGKPTEGIQFRRIILKEMSQQIIFRMTNAIVVTSTAVVSSVLLMNRRGISEDILIKTVNQLVKYILAKGYKVGGVNQSSSVVAVRNAVSHLSGITTKSKKNIFELTISAGDELQKILMLSYYRNTLTHCFLPEAFVGCVIVSFGQQLSTQEGVGYDRVCQQCAFLTQLLKDEYFMDYRLSQTERFAKTITFMKDNGILEDRSGDKLAIGKNGLRMIAFLCSLLRAQIQSYWASLVYILSIARNNERRYETTSLDKFYDTVQWFMESLYGEKVIEDYEACSLESIKHAFAAYDRQKLIKISPGSRKKESVVQVLASNQQLDELENQIKFFRKNTHNSVLSPTEMARNSLTALPRL